MQYYIRLGWAKKTKVVQSFSASILCEGHMYKDFRNIIFQIFRHVLGVPQGGSNINKVDFQVTPIALLLGV